MSDKEAEGATSGSDTTGETPQIGTRNVRPVVNHGSAFGAPGANRAQGLAGGFAPPARRPTSPPVAPAETDGESRDDERAQEVEEVDVPSAASGPRPPQADELDRQTQSRSQQQGSVTRPPARRPRGATREVESRTGGGRSPATTARLPEALKKRLARHSQRRNNLNYALILIEAFNLFYKTIDDLFVDDNDERESLGLPEGGGLFPPRPISVRDTRGVGTEQVNFMLTAEERRVIETLLKAHPRIPDRNALIVRVLRAYLDRVEPEVQSEA